MKIILGTANVKNKYGLNANNLNIKEFNKVKNYSKKNNFYMEVAEDYKNLKYISADKIRLFYKINFYKNKNNINEINKIIRNKNLICIMLHNIKSMNYSGFKKIYNYINLLKSKKIIKNLGISIYDLKDLKTIQKYNFDFVQIPINLFNQTFNERNTLSLRKKGTKFIARSIFFQGTIFNDGYLKLNSKILNNKIKNIQKELFKKKIDILKFYLNYIKINSWLWGFVVGVDSLNQLKQIKNTHQRKKFNHNYQKYRIHEKKIIDPRNW